MFKPIKTFITYIQKNASGNSMFGGNCTIEGSKMDAEDLKAESIIANVETGSEVPIKVDKDIPETEEEKKNFTDTKKLCSELQELEFRGSTLTTSLAPSENVSEFEDDDIENQIQSSIMLKKPLKVTSTNGTEILELKKSSGANCGIVISHNRNQDLSSVDDELEDFKNDPMEVSGGVSSSCSHQNNEDFCSVGSAEEALESTFRGMNDFSTEDEDGEVVDKKTEGEQKEVFESDLELEEEKDIETENEQSVIEVEDEEEPFLDLESFKSSNSSVLDEVDLNTSTASLDTNNTADDPLAIPCEDHEAFSADKNAALEELNLLNNSQISQDDDTTTTTDEDLRWLKTDPENNQPSCSRKVLLKDKNLTVMPEKEERNGEGSDSGLGSETSVLHTTITSITDTSQLNINTASLTHSPIPIKTKDSEKISNPEVLQEAKSASENAPKPYRSNLKRRLEVDDAGESLDSSITPTSSSLNEHIQKKPKRSINFDTVQVYYFPRQQGFSCVPSAGGCTLGMGARHVAFRTLSLAEHAAELRRAHRMQLQEINPRGSSSDDSEESEEDYLSEGSGSDLDGESNGFLQPVSPKQRRALLKAAGIRKIDPIEKAECRNIRNSREVCGCTCRDFCDPETCACSQSGIKCQVDRDMFPCGCSRDACGNTIGRVEFNPTRVRTHYIHTLMRLEMENRQQQNPYSSAVVSPIQPSPSSFYQTHLQPSSNYSSGYASPAYNTVSEIHHQTVANVYYHTHSPSTSNVMYGQQTSLEMPHNGTATTASTTSHYGIDSLGSSLFGGTTTTPSYGELMPVASYHFGNVQTQDSPYNSYHDTSYINTNTNGSSLSSSRSAYSSCAVPSIPPFGAATTTEAAGIYHSVSSLTNLETTTAPSCSVNSNGTSLESDSSASFINLSTPLASSSRLSQINDLLQHNRNATTALVAVSDNIEATDKKSSTAASPPQANSNNFQTTDSSLCSSFHPSLADTNKSCIALEELVPPIKSVPLVPVFENNNTETVKTTTTCSAIEENSTKHVEELSLLKTDFLPKTSLYEVDTDTTTLMVNASIKPSTIRAAAGN